MQKFTHSNQSIKQYLEQCVKDYRLQFQISKWKNNEILFKSIARKKAAQLLPEIGGPKKRRKIGAIAQRALQHYEEKYGRAPAELLGVRPQTKEEQDDELEDLFDSVVEEIEERQEYLESIEQVGGKKDIEARVKNEIVDRIGELQKIRELQNRQGKTRTTK